MIEDYAEAPLVVAEKPSVARHIDSVLRSKGVKAKVASVRGHLMNADFPEGYGWNRIDPSMLFLVRDFRQVIQDKTSYNSLVKSMKGCGLLVIATDNDPEGELIGYEILTVYRKIKGDDAAYKRMRFNSTSPTEIWNAWDRMESSLNWGWVMKAMFRQHFDLVTGAAFTRLLTERTRKHRYVRLISWGSCQSPTLYFIVEREKEIISFKSEPFWYLWARLRTKEGEEFEAVGDVIKDKEIATSLWENVKGFRGATVHGYEEEYKTLRRPLPLNTDELLKDLTRITGASASAILSVAEELYADGYISYPRTETNRFGKDFDFREPIAAIRSSELSRLLYGLDFRSIKPLNGRSDDGAHPPIYPLRPYPRDRSMRWTVWEYVARRFAANVLFEDCRLFVSRARIDIGGAMLRASGSKIVKRGFLEIFDYFMPREEHLPRMAPGEELEVVDIKLREGKTRPPRRLSEAELLSMMERFGIGTDATRAEYPRLVVDRGYAIKRGGVFYPTELGMRLIDALSQVDKRLVTPDTRRLVEEYMTMIGKGLTAYKESLDKALSIYEELYKNCELKIDDISRVLAESIKNAASRRYHSKET